MKNQQSTQPDKTIEIEEFLDKKLKTEQEKRKRLELEVSILGGVFFNPSIASEILAILKVEDFQNVENRLIFRAFVKLFKLSEPIDMVTVCELLNDEGRLQDTGGRNYIMQVCMSVTTSENTVYYAKKLVSLSQKREITFLLQKMNRVIDEVEPLELAATLRQELEEIENRSTVIGHKTVKELLPEALERLDLLNKNSGVIGLRTGFNALDSLTGGFIPGEITFLGARSGHGKTALAVNMATQVALINKVHVLFVSIEMTAIQLLTRSLKSGTSSYYNPKSMIDYAEDLNEYFHIADFTSIKTDQLELVCREHQRKYGSLGLVVVDYLQNIKSNGRTEVEEIKLASQTLTKVAKLLNVPILCLSQFNRNIEGRADKKPLKSDFKGSGQIEQDGHILMATDMPWKYDEEASPGQAKIHVIKARDAQEGVVPVHFSGSYAKFTEFKNL